MASSSALSEAYCVHRAISFAVMPLTMLPMDKIINTINFVNIYSQTTNL